MRGPFICQFKGELKLLGNHRHNMSLKGNYRLLVEQYMQKSDSKQRRVLRMIDKIDSLDFQSNQERRMCSLRHLIVIVEDILSCHHSTLRMYLWKWQRRIKYLKALRLRVTNSVQRLKNYTMNEYMVRHRGFRLRLTLRTSKQDLISAFINTYGNLKLVNIFVEFRLKRMVMRMIFQHFLILKRGYKEEGSFVAFDG